MSSTESESDASSTGEREFSLIANGELLQESMKAVNAVVDEIRLHLTPQGLSTKAVDPANVAMVFLHVPADKMEHYDATGFKTGLNTTRFETLVGKADSDDLVELQYPTDDFRMGVKFGDVNYTMALIDADSIRQEPNDPQPDRAHTFEINGDVIGEATEMVDMVSDYVGVHVDPDVGEVRFEGEGDTDDVSVDRQEGEGDLQFKEMGDEATMSLFSMEYWKDISKVIDSYDTVEITVGEEMPITLDVGHIRYMIAPRIQKS